jgi:prolyl oligopeptidase
MPTLLLALGLAAVGCPAPDRIETPVRPVTDIHHGVEVTEDYRWLEDASAAEVVAWRDAQSARTRAHLGSLPYLEEIRARVTELMTSTSVSYRKISRRGATLFALKKQPPREQPFLVMLSKVDVPQTERIVVDPNEIDSTGLLVIDWYVPSPDGSLVAVSLSRGGSEAGDLHLYETASGEEVDAIVPRVNDGTAGGDLAWTPDGSGFYYTRYPSPGEVPDDELSFHQEVWYHALGSSSSEDRYELGREHSKIAEFRLDADPASARVLATYQYGDSGRFRHHLRLADGRWVQLTEEDDEVVQATYAPDGTLFLVSRKGALRGKMLRLPPGATSMTGVETIVAEGDDTIVSDFYGPRPILATSTRLYVRYQLGGPTTVRAFDHEGNPQPGPDVPPVSRVRGMASLGGDAILFETESYLEPSAWLHFDPVAGTTGRTALAEQGIDFSDTIVVRETATSADGTEVPVNILRPAELELDGTHPVLLTGYGGYGVSREPRYDATIRLWLERGGILAEANLRGGGEFGEQWHRDGMLTRKQNVFDDFAGAMRHMIDAGYTSPERLAIKGGSNGGLLMGAMITQHPELSRVVVSRAGIYDMLRVELSPNGAFNIPEFGTVEDPEQFAALYAYSPYHNVEDGVSYPAVLFTTGANDPRVDPMQSRKMIARLQRATRSDLPILLRTSDTAGHGADTALSERIDELTDVYAFVFHQLGMGS